MIACLCGLTSSELLTLGIVLLVPFSFYLTHIDGYAHLLKTENHSIKYHKLKQCNL